MITAPEDFSAVREALEAAGIPMAEADVTMIPQTWVERPMRTRSKDEPHFDLLDEDDDVQATYHNWKNNIEMRSRLKKIILSEPAFCIKKRANAN